MSGLWVLTLACALALGSSQEQDLTLQVKATGTEVVEATVDLLKESCLFADDALLLRRIAWVESSDGASDLTFLRGGNNYNGGIWQVDETDFKATQKQFGLFTNIKDTFGIDWSRAQWSDCQKPLYSALAARIKIYSGLGADLPRSTSAQSTYWSEKYRGGDNPPDTQIFVDAIKKLDSSCGVPKADIVFVLDGSGSIGADNFVTMKDFVNKVVAAFSIGVDAVRIGLIQFSSDTATEFYLGEYDHKDNILDKVTNIKYRKGGTNSAAALEALRSMFSSKGRAGDGVPQICIFMTDGKSNDPTATAKAAASLHADTQITVFAVGVGSGIDHDELKEIGSDPDCVHVFELADFNDFLPFVDQIERQTCRAPAEILPDNEIDGTVITGSRIFFKLKVTKIGITLRLKVWKGAVRMFMSWKVRNPSVAMYRYSLLISPAMIDGGSLFIPWNAIKYPKASTAELFVSMMGMGVAGDDNAFKLQFKQGNHNSAAVNLQPMMITLVLAVTAFLFH